LVDFDVPHLGTDPGEEDDEEDDRPELEVEKRG
jgi:hypothetical protein